MHLREEDIVERCAMVAHEVNRSYAAFIGDDSIGPWDESPDWQRKSVVSGVRAVLLDPDWTPEKSHEGWLRYKKEEGWAYGDTKDPDKKTHPCMVPYDQLPDIQRLKDHLFVSAVRATYRSLTEAP